MLHIIYLRKSRADNDNEPVEETLRKHEIQLQEFAAREFGAPIEEQYIYREVASGETIADRPMFGRVLDRMELGDVDGVIVIEPQRLTRGDLSDCGRVINACRYTRTKVLTPVRSYDLSDKFDRKMIEMELLRGNDYLEYTKEILNRGRIASVKRGCFIGSIAPYGYRKTFVDEERRRMPTLAIDEAEAEGVRMAFDLYANHGKGASSIMRALNEAGIPPRNKKVWTTMTIEEIITNPVYIGKVRWNWRKNVKSMVDGVIKSSRPKSQPEDWIIADGLHPAIIDAALFAKAAEHRGKVSRTRVSYAPRNAFTGLCYCQCGRIMVYREYRNRSHPEKEKNKRLLCLSQTQCRTRSIDYDIYTARVIESLKKSYADFCVRSHDPDKQTENPSARITTLKKQIAALDARETEQYDLLENKIYTREIFLARNKSLQEERQKLALRLEAIESAQNSQLSAADIAAKYTATIAALEDENTPVALKNQYICEIVDRIIYKTAQTTDTKSRNSPEFEVDVQLSI